MIQKIQAFMFIYVSLDIAISKAEKGEKYKAYKYIVFIAIYLLLFLI